MVDSLPRIMEKGAQRKHLRAGRPVREVSLKVAAVVKDGWQARGILIQATTLKINETLIQHFPAIHVTNPRVDIGCTLRHILSLGVFFPLIPRFPDTRQSSVTRYSTKLRMKDGMEKSC